jgi:Cysteine-rich secretory protein family
MRIISLSILGFLLFTLFNCKPSLDTRTTPEVSAQVTSFQQMMLAEINFARTDPAGYAETRLRSALDDSVDNGSFMYMKGKTPLLPLSFNYALNLSASNYALFLAQKDLMGHNQNGTPLKRAITVGFVGSSVGENIAASTSDYFNSILDPQTAAMNFVKIMIIDAGVDDLGHRMTLLSPIYTTIGIGFSRNPTSTFVNYSVQDYGNL